MLIEKGKALIERGIPPIKREVTLIERKITPIAKLKALRAKPHAAKIHHSVGKSKLKLQAFSSLYLDAPWNSAIK
jgi:hypothetical protein